MAETQYDQLEHSSEPASFQHARPRLKSGQIFSSMSASSYLGQKESQLMFELADGSRQISLPSEAANILPMLDGSKTIPEILESLHRMHGRVPFRVFFSTLQKLQTQGCLEGAEQLVTSASQARAEMFERAPLWLTRPIWSYNLAPGKLIGSPSLFAFILAAAGTILITVSFMAAAFVFGLVQVPVGFLRIDESYVKGLLFFFVAASALITAKTVIKTLLSLLLTGSRSALNIELNLFSFALRSSDDKIYMAGGRGVGSLAFGAVACSYFFVFAVASAVSAAFAPRWPLLDDLLWVSATLALIDLNPFRKSDLSSYFNIVYNQRSAAELLPYLKNRGILAMTSGAKLADSWVYTAYSTIAIVWTMVSYNLLLSLISQNDTLLASVALGSLKNGPFAEFVAAAILGISLSVSFLYLVVDLFRTIMTNVLHPLKTKRLSKQSKKAKAEPIENAEILAKSISHIPLFSGLHIDTILFLVSKGEARRIPKGNHIIVQETISDELFILLEGEVTVNKRQPTGATQEVTRLKAPTVFGENTLLANQPRSADVVANTPIRVLAIPRKAVEELSIHKTLSTDADAFMDRLMLGQYVASSDLFREAPKEVVSLFFNEGQVVTIPTGRQIIEQGRTDKDFYLLIRGAVEVISSGRIVAQLQQGDFFGEMALILNSPRTATVITKEPCRVLKLTAAQFWRVLSRHASIALYLETVSENRVQSAGGNT